MSLVGLMLAAGSGALASGCTIQADMVEDSIKDELKKKDVEVDKITCPKGEKLKDGATFECKGTSDQGDDFVVKVKQTDSKGSIKWDLEGRIVDPEEFADDAKKNLGFKVDCGKKKFIAVKGTKMKCKADGKTATVTFKDDEGKIDASELEALR